MKKIMNSNKIGFVSPERRNEAPDRCTAAANVICLLWGKMSVFVWFPKDIHDNAVGRRIPAKVLKIKEQHT